MSNPEVGASVRFRTSIAQFVIIPADGARRWAATEFGGWTIIGVLGLAVLSALVALMLDASRPVAGSRSRVPQAVETTGQPAAAEILDLIVAPQTIQDLTFDEARAWNARLPVSDEPILAAPRFIAPVADLESYGRALDCLTAAIYYEAASETPVGQAAVAQVILNRARHPAYPRTVCGVVFQGSERATGCQFTFTCDGALARRPSTAGWARARATAAAALNGAVLAAVGTATHYHTDWVAPYWAQRLSKITQIATHIFYRWNGAWGRPAAFTGVYAGAEPAIEKMALLATALSLPEPIVPEETFTLVDRTFTRVSPVTEIETARLVPIEADITQVPTSEGTEQQAEIAPPPPRQETAPLADPLANPAVARPRQRTRVAAPSNW